MLYRPGLKSYFNVNGSVSSLAEGQVRHLAPQLESLSDLLVHLLSRDDCRVRVARHPVGQGQRPPAAEREMFNVKNCWRSFSYINDVI